MLQERQLLYTNDLHDRGARALNQVHALARPDALILDGGDALGGSNTAFRLEEPILAEMRRCGYRAMAMGNREFHYFRSVLRWREQERGFPLLAANLRDLRRPHGSWQSHLYVDWSGLRLALIGLTVVQYPVGSRWERLTGFRFYPPESSLARLLPCLEGRCDATVILSHLGLSEDRRLAHLFPSVRLILGAHSHDALSAPLRVGPCAIVQAGSHGRHVGELTLRDDDWSNLHWRLHLTP